MNDRGQHSQPGTIAWEPTELLDAIGDPVLLLEPDGTIKYANPAMLEFINYDATDIHGRHVNALIPTTQRQQFSDRLLTTGENPEQKSPTLETQILTSDGTPVLTEVTATPHTQTNIDTAGLVCVFRDIRQRKHRERNLDLIKQVLMRVLRHNIRNKLMTVQAHTEILANEVDDDLTSHATEVLAATDRLLTHGEKARLIETVLENDTRLEMDLISTVIDTVDAVHADYPNADLTTSLPATTASVSAHPNLPDAIEEILRNALEHVSDSAQTEVEIWIEENAETTTLFVEDESGGLDPHEIEVLRDGGETDLEHASGVGLWLVRWVVDYSDAELIVHRTEAGTIMGIKFQSVDSQSDARQETLQRSLFTPAPDTIQETSPHRFRGDTVIRRIDKQQELKERYDNLPQTGGHTIVITGEPGIGKTTLVEQFRRRLSGSDDAPIIANGVCASDIQSPYQPFSQVVADLPGDRAFTDILADAAAFDASDAEEAQQRKRVLFADIATRIREVASEQPVVMIVEDLHWADTGTIDLFEYLIGELGRWSDQVLLLCTYRTSDIETDHPALELAEDAADMGRGTVLELESFDTDRVASLLKHMFETDEIPQSFVESVRDHTGGTPLFVNELGKHLVEAHGPFAAPGEIPSSLDVVSVPDTIETAVTERLDALSEAVMPTLELGAILGESFSFEVLREASERSTDTLIASTNTLVDRDVWNRTEDNVTFIHGVLREQTHARIDEETRETLHERVATAIETVYADSLDEYAGRLATHYEALGDYEQAFEYLWRAGDVASESYANEAAIETYRQALDLADTHDVATDDEAASVCASLAETLIIVGEYAQASEAIETGIAYAPTQSELHCRLLNARAKMYHGQSAFSEAIETANRQQEIASSLELKSLEVDALRHLALAKYRRGVSEKAIESLERGLNIATEIGDQQGQAVALSYLGWITHRQGEHERAMEYLERSLAIARKLDDRPRQAKVLNHLGVAANHRGAYDEAQQYLNESLDMYAEVGRPTGEASCLANLGLVTQRRGEYTQASEYYERCMEIFEEIGDRYGLALTRINLGVVARCRGEYDQARAYYERSLAISEEIEFSEGQVISLTYAGYIARLIGEYDTAEEYLTRAEEILAELETPEWEILHTRERAALARERERYAQAETDIEHAMNVCETAGFPRKHARVYLERASLDLARENPQAAREAVEQAREQLEGRDIPLEEGRGTLLEGQIAAQLDRPETAREYWQTALERFTDLGTPHHALATLEQLVEHTRKAGDTDAAREYCRQARDVLMAAPDSVGDAHRDWVEHHASALGLSDSDEDS